VAGICVASFARCRVSVIGTGESSGSSLLNCSSLCTPLTDAAGSLFDPRLPAATLHAARVSYRAVPSVNVVATCTAAVMKCSLCATFGCKYLSVGAAN